MELFHHARTSTLDDLNTAPSPTDFWYNYALPLSHSFEAVRHAVCALGGAHRVFKLRRSVESKLALDQLERASIQQYNRAIASIKSVMASATERDMEVILTCCVIFIGLENLHGHYAESLRHMKAGTSLLVSLLSQCIRQQHTDLLTAGDTISDGNGRMVSSSSLLGRRPNLEFLDDFAQTLSRLANDVWMYIREMIAPDLNVYDATDDVGSYFPKQSFDSVGEAEKYLHAVIRLLEVDGAIIDHKLIVWSRQAHRGRPVFESSDMLLTPWSSIMSPGAAENMFWSWSERFDHFQSQFDESTATRQDVLRKRALAVDQALWSGWLRCTDWRIYRPEDFEEIVRRAELLVELDAFKSSPVFAFDGSLILCLALPCVESEDSALQWRTIRLLRSFWRREGIWDSHEVADILEATVIATSKGVVAKNALPWDVPNLARLMASLNLDEVYIPNGPQLIVDT